jgi:hypothetical protein
MNQTDKVLAYLQTPGRTLTAKQARSRFGIQRLSARICELREEGFDIVSTPVVYRETKAQGVKYSLAVKTAKTKNKTSKR